MRRFKFRAYDKYELKMVYKFTLGSDTDMDSRLWTCPMTLQNEGKENQRWVNNDSLIIMQYTGLIDKNGKEIFENDILKYIGGTGIVIYNGSGFYIKNIENSGDMTMDLKQCIEINNAKIIGNIYENIELLKDN